jgi:BirA family biotin operon repressor/biotin-[acetyl-CoA-carboxylase] ligase
MEPGHATLGDPAPHVVGTWVLHHVAETGSTNDDLWALAEAGAANHTALRADHQTAGKGRLDRRWEAPVGENLLVSLLFREVPAEPGTLVHAVALAAADTCRDVAGVDVTLKWPNDLLGRDGVRKMAGILAQAGPIASDSGTARPTFVIVGLGLNVNWAPDDATSLSGEAGDRPFVVDAVCRDLLVNLDRVLAWSSTHLHDEYRRRLGTVGREVRVSVSADEIVEGRALDVEADGRLVVLDRCGVTHRFAVGDVVHVRTTSFGS